MNKKFLGAGGPVVHGPGHAQRAAGGYRQVSAATDARA
jgi:hypothetical protein